ncbi:MAG: hypothetical protein IIB35_11030 [Gemmatimonadetes bacterium]|nr:hypothetical protein [Gemmatimonadota bacterium]
MPHRPQQRVKFISHEMASTPEGHRRAEVTLEIPPNRTFVGTADCSEVSPGDLRCAALATVDALHRAMGDADNSLELIGARAVRAFDAHVVIVALSVNADGRTRRLVGSFLADKDLARGAAIAVLSATNRLLGRMMFAE